MMPKMHNITTENQTTEGQREEECWQSFIFFRVSSSQNCKLTSAFPVTLHLQSSTSVSLKIQGISRLVYLTFFFFFNLLVENLLKKHLSKALCIISNQPHLLQSQNLNRTTSIHVNGIFSSLQVLAHRTTTRK